jgi:hypothetical protein
MELNCRACGPQLVVQALAGVSEYRGFEMKSAMGNTVLVIHVENANELIAQHGPISRWIMGHNQAMFDSPVRIPVACLKCDPNWLWQKANEMLAANRISHRPPEGTR